jgi:hypothetical protein
VRRHGLHTAGGSGLPLACGLSQRVREREREREIPTHIEREKVGRGFRGRWERMKLACGRGSRARPQGGSWAGRLSGSDARRDSELGWSGMAWLRVALA